MMTYSISNRLFKNKSAAFLAALFMALNPLTIYMAHMSKVDTALTFSVLLSFYFSLRIQENGRQRYVVLAGISAGLAMATKYDFITILPPFAAVYFYYRHHEAHLSGRIFLLIAIGLLTFFLASPFTLLDLHGFIMDLRSESAQQGLSLSTLGWVHTRFVYQLLVQLPFCLSVSVYVFFMAGLFRFKTFLNDETSILYLSYPFSYFIFSTSISASISQIIFSHLYLTILPFIIMLSSAAVVYFISKINRRILKYSIMGIMLVDVCIAS
jgi:4-amino-4-deoxy-L-arabinose transferase-like glycosyltransferase